MAELLGHRGSSLTRVLLTEPARPDRIRSLPRAPWLAVATVCVGAFMGQLDASIVTVALPRLRADLRISLSAAEWVSLAYLLVLVGTVLAVGRIADMHGRKLLYTYGFALFGLASLGCGVSSTLSELVGCRVLQAVGAALLQANSVALIRTTVAPGQLNRAIGWQGAAQALGLALGPTLGGLLIAAGGWRWVFWVNLPVAAIGIVSGVLLLPRTRIRACRARFDWAGFGCLLPATAALLLGLSLLPGRTLRAGLSSALISYLVLFAALLLCSLFVQARLHLPAAQAGLLISILPAALAVLAPVAGTAAGRHAWVPAAGLAVAALGLGCAAVLPGGLAGAVLLLALTGAGLGLFLPANNAMVAGRGRPDQAGLVSGVLNMTRGIGTALGVAVAGASYSIAEPVAGFRRTSAVLAALALLGVLINRPRSALPRNPTADQPACR